MHPNDSIYLLALLLVAPLARAAPIFPDSNDIDQNGRFLPASYGPPRIPTMVSRDLSGDINGAIDDLNTHIGTLAGDLSPNLNPPDIPNLPSKRDFIGDIGQAVDTVGDTVEGVLGNRFGKRDAQISGNLPRLNPPFVCFEINGCYPPDEFVTKRDIIGDIGQAVDKVGDTVEGVLGSIFSKRDEELSGILPLLRPGLVPNPPFTCAGINACSPPDFLSTKRDFIGDIGQAVENVGDTVEGVLGSIFSKRDGEMTGTLPRLRPDLYPNSQVACASINGCGPVNGQDGPIFQAANAKRAEDPIEGTLGRRDLNGDLNSAIDSVNQHIDTIVGDISPNLNVPDIPNIPSRRDLNGDLNGVIDSVNQHIDTIVGDISPSLDVPNIPNIPSRR